MLDIIRRRRSVRTYSDKEFSDDLKNQVMNIVGRREAGPFGNTPQFTLVEKELAHREQKVRLGTYGIIQGARYFIAGTVDWGGESGNGESDNMVDVDFGYLMEGIVLEMTRLGLGTCWLGGALHRGDYLQVLDIDDKTRIPAVVALGYPGNGLNAVGSVFRFTIRADHRKPFGQIFFDGDFQHPLTQKTAGRYATTLEMVRIAPSAANIQPWRIVMEEQNLHLFLERVPGFRTLAGAVMQATDMQRIDLGIAMRHLETAAGQLSQTGSWQRVDVSHINAGNNEYIITWKSGG